jgi:hypothetical protein
LEREKQSGEPNIGSGLSPAMPSPPGGAMNDIFMPVTHTRSRYAVTKEVGFVIDKAYPFGLQTHALHVLDAPDALSLFNI